MACGPEKAGSDAVAPPPATRQATTKIVVQPGQSLDAIAHAFRVPKRDIIALNQLVPPYQLKAGAILELPAGAAPSPVVQAKPRPKPASPADTAPPVRTAKVAPPRSAKPKPSEAEVIPLD